MKKYKREAFDLIKESDREFKEDLENFTDEIHEKYRKKTMDVIIAGLALLVFVGIGSGFLIKVFVTGGLTSGTAFWVVIGLIALFDVGTIAFVVDSIRKNVIRKKQMDAKRLEVNKKPEEEASEKK